MAHLSELNLLVAQIPHDNPQQSSLYVGINVVFIGYDDELFEQTGCRNVHLILRW